MRPGDPLSLILAADSRLSRPDYCNDQIWEVIPNGGDPPAFLLRSTLGLRCLSLKIFPRFFHGNRILSNPDEFFRPPVLTSFHPNYLAFSLSILPQLDGIIEFRVVDSQTITGKTGLINRSQSPLQFQLEWCAILNPLPDGRSFSPLETGSLSGKSGDLVPVFYLSNDPETGTGPLPSLRHHLNIRPDHGLSFIWGFSARKDAAASLASARQAASGQWEAETARIELLNSGQSMQITTGQPDWDAVLSMSQKTAFSLVLPGSKHLPHPTFILSRLPDHGYSNQGSGSDYSHLWSGQSPLDLYFLSRALLPADLDRVKGMFQNFIDIQDQDGFIDLKPGLAGQRMRLLATPILATLALDLYRYRSDDEWLSSVFPPLLKFFNLWFTPAHDRDQDGFPEWDHAIQAGLEEVPLFDNWRRESQGINSSMVESPSLAAFLFREAKSLVQMARLTGHSEAVSGLIARMDNLQKALENSWDPAVGIFQYRDFQNHHSRKGFVWIEFKGSGKFHSRRNLQTAQRLRIQIRCKEENTRPVSILILGENREGEVIEQISPVQFTWVEGTARFVTKHIYNRIKKVEVRGLQDEDEGQISACDLKCMDISLFLPLWASMVTKKQADEMVEKALHKGFIEPFGIPLVPADMIEPETSSAINTHLIWNLFVIEGLLNYGFQKEAVDLAGRLMNAAVGSLKLTHSFCEHTNALTGRPVGERGHLRGLIPAGIFLSMIGVQIISNKELIITGINIFPWPITVKYKGTSITRHHKDSVITFINGQTVTVNGPESQRVIIK